MNGLDRSRESLRKTSERLANRSFAHIATPGPAGPCRSALSPIKVTIPLPRIVQTGSAFFPTTIECASSETADDSRESGLRLLCSLSNGRRLCPPEKRCAQIQETIGIA